MGTQGDVLGQRIVAVIIDGLLTGLAGGLIAGIGVSLMSSNPGQMSPLMSYIFTPLILLYYIVLEAMYGQTVGKMVINIMVVKKDGSECGWDGSLIRNILRPIDAFFGYLVGLITILASDDSQRIGDHAAKTLVVETE